MDLVLTVIGSVLVVAGALVFVTAGLGLIRFPDPYTRISATGCKKPVQAIKVHGSNHFWWYSPSAADEMWAFLMRNPK